MLMIADCLLLGLLSLSHGKLEAEATTSSSARVRIQLVPVGKTLNFEVE